MAIGLDRVNRSRPKTTNKSSAKVAKPNPTISTHNIKTKKAPPLRPWQVNRANVAARPPLSQDPMLDFDIKAESLFLTPEDLDAATTTQLLQQLAVTWLQETWRKTQRQSYWLSRLTHQKSWLARVQLFPKIKIPLPSWLSHRDSNF